MVRQLEVILDHLVADIQAVLQYECILYAPQPLLHLNAVEADWIVGIAGRQRDLLIPSL